MGRWVAKNTIQGNPRSPAAYADKNNWLRLMPGKHTVRVAYEINRLVGDAAVRGGQAISNRLEIEIVDPQ